MFRQICDAIAYAATQGITHRDIKPENILLRGENGPIVIADWGICFVENGERLTLTEEAVGTRYFMCPVLERGSQDANIIKTADVYSLGKILYWLLSGRRLTREEYRERDYNLVQIFRSPYYEHFNKMLDLMVQERPEYRFQDVSSLPKAFANAVRLFIKEFNVGPFQINQPCRYCGQGKYHYVVKPDEPQKSLEYLGYVTRNTLILECDYCGNMQHFRVVTEAVKRFWGVS